MPLLLQLFKATNLFKVAMMLTLSSVAAGKLLAERDIVWLINLFTFAIRMIEESKVLFFQRLTF